MQPFRSKVHKTSTWMLVLLVPALLIVSGCPKKWISDYDPEIDRVLTEMQVKTEELILQIEKKRSVDATRVNAYVDWSVASLNALLSRINGDPLNEKTADQMRIMKGQFEKLREFGSDGLDQSEVEDAIKPNILIGLGSMVRSERRKFREAKLE